MASLRLLCNSLRPIEGTDIETTLAGYGVALDGCPAWAIASAARKFLQNKVPGQNRVYCPRPPELRAAVDAELAPVYRRIEEEARRARMRAEAAEYAPTPPLTPQGKARAAEIYREFCRSHAMNADEGGGHV